MVLATCNRFEAYLDVDASTAPMRPPRPWTSSAPPAASPRMRWAARSACSPGTAWWSTSSPCPRGSSRWSSAKTRFPARCAGPWRRRAPRSTTSSQLERLFQKASHTAREIKTGTALGGAGRSLVRLALELASSRITDWSQTPVLDRRNRAVRRDHAGGAAALRRARRARLLPVRSRREVRAPPRRHAGGGPHRRRRRRRHRHHLHLGGRSGDHARQHRIRAAAAADHRPRPAQERRPRRGRPRGDRIARPRNGQPARAAGRAQRDQRRPQHGGRRGRRIRGRLRRAVADLRNRRAAHPRVRHPRGRDRPGQGARRRQRAAPRRRCATWSACCCTRPRCGPGSWRAAATSRPSSMGSTPCSASSPRSREPDAAAERDDEATAS